MNKIKVLVVLYNKTINSSETCISLMRLKAQSIQFISDIYIWNNSPSLLPPEEKSTLEAYYPQAIITYWEDGINHPLSYVYNFIISKINNEGILILFDHDSVFEDKFIYRLQTAVQNNQNINLFLPKIYYANQLVSPGKQYYFYGRYLKKIAHGIISSRFLTAINSGMAIRCSYLKNTYEGYNEEIKYYGTDNDFMYKYSKKNNDVYILNVSLTHTLNYYEDRTLDAKLKRYKDMKNGILVQMRDTHYIIYLFSYVYFFLYECKMNIIHKTFLFWNK